MVVREMMRECVCKRESVCVYETDREREREGKRSSVFMCINSHSGFCDTGLFSSENFDLDSFFSFFDQVQKKTFF